ncbi:hypothetical protein [Mesorhizobium sp. WSM3626]|uniref:hypothetical protein n=1 Tax=Mesorhizobium sp. WSM3626 TaxID=1040987 RepID=UPI0004ACFF76|nr:hypothetical protein [Mesorhizobium sp. WSM3626]
MSDGPSKLADGMTLAPRERVSVLGHLCEHKGCAKHAGFGFAWPRRDPHWFCSNAGDDGEQYL